MKYSTSTRIYIRYSLVEKENLFLTEEYYHYAKNVLRLKVGSKVRLFNDQDGEFEAKIIQYHKHEVEVRIEKLLRTPSTLLPLTLIMSMIKSDKLLDLVDSAVQLGITQLQLVSSEYSSATQVNMEKLEKRIACATQQSERFTPPTIMPLVKIKDYTPNFDAIVYADEHLEEKIDLLSYGNLKGSIALLVGPEGGFSEQDRKIISAWQKLRPISLGATVLRSETAVIAALAQIHLLRKKAL